MIGRIRIWARSDRGRTHLRYAGASGASVLVGQTALAVGFGVLRWSAMLANLFGFLLGGIVSYTMNRRWTWGRGGRSHLLREVLPFWVIAGAGLLLSTMAVAVAARTGTELTDSRTLRTGLVMGASLGAFGALWVVKFVIFDRYVFAPGSPAPSASQASTAASREASIAASSPSSRS